MKRPCPLKGEVSPGLSASRRRWARALRLAGASLLAGVALVGCSLAGGSRTETVSATFSDIGDLVPGAPVQIGGVKAGQVTGIGLTKGNQARVTMSIPRSAHVPAQVKAQIVRPTLLGQDVVNLVPLTHSPRARRLASGAVIRDTSLVPGLEQLTLAGSHLFGSLSANQISLILHESAVGFGGEGPALHDLLANFDQVIHGYASRTDQITSVIRGFDKLNTALAPHARANATAVVNLAQNVKELQDQSNRLLNLLAKLKRFSVQQDGILSAYLPQINESLSGLESVTADLKDKQRALGLLLHYLPYHNRATVSATRQDFVQILQDLIFCGAPGGGSNPDSPANSCH